jgi:hypothetical protein
VLARPREGDWFALPLPVDGYAVGDAKHASHVASIGALAGPAFGNDA